MRDHVEVGDAVRWPADSAWLWTVDHVLTTPEGPRLLAISRGETEADIVTRVVPETDVSSHDLAPGGGIATS